MRYPRRQNQSRSQSNCASQPRRSGDRRTEQFVFSESRDQSLTFERNATKMVVPMPTDDSISSSPPMTASAAPAFPRGQVHSYAHVGCAATSAVSNPGAIVINCEAQCRTRAVDENTDRCRALRMLGDICQGLLHNTIDHGSLFVGRSNQVVRHCNKNPPLSILVTPLRRGNWSERWSDPVRRWRPGVIPKQCDGMFCPSAPTFTKLRTRSVLRPSGPCLNTL